MRQSPSVLQPAEQLLTLFQQRVCGPVVVLDQHRIAQERERHRQLPQAPCLSQQPNTLLIEGARSREIPLIPSDIAHHPQRAGLSLLIPPFPRDRKEYKTARSTFE